MAVTKRTIPQHHLPGRYLGRHVHHDDASREFPAAQATKIVDTIHVSVGLPLDQGDIGSCTANALCGALNSAPDNPSMNRLLTEADAVSLYEIETRMEGDPYPPNDPGGSGLMVCRAAKSESLLTAYHHAFGIQHALQALVLRPAIFGIDWMSSFDTPDPTTGVVTWTRGASVRGGHEILADEINVTDKLIGFWNSWGDSYGLGGKFYMEWATVERLLAGQGDCTVPIP